MRLGWAVTTDHFSCRAPNATQHECCELGAHFTLHGVVFAILCPGPACTAHSVSKTRVNALAEALRCVRDTRSLVLRACGESIQLQPITLQALLQSVFQRKPAPDLIRGGDRLGSRKRVKSRIWSSRFDSIETETALARRRSDCPQRLRHHRDD